MLDSQDDFAEVVSCAVKICEWLYCLEGKTLSVEQWRLAEQAEATHKPHSVFGCSNAGERDSYCSSSFGHGFVLRRPRAI